MYLFFTKNYFSIQKNKFLLDHANQLNYQSLGKKKLNLTIWKFLNELRKMIT